MYEDIVIVVAVVVDPVVDVVDIVVVSTNVVSSHSVVVSSTSRVWNADVARQYLSSLSERYS